jgi:hypothetical protein
MPNDGQEKEQRGDKATEHVWPVLSQVLAVVKQLFALKRELLRDMDRVM